MSNSQTTSYLCAYCGLKAQFACSLCGTSTSYCSQNCQYLHWPLHQPACHQDKTPHPPPPFTDESYLNVEHGHREQEAVSLSPVPDTVIRRPQMQIPESTILRLNQLGFDYETASDLLFYTRQVYKLLLPILLCITLSILWAKLSVLSVFRPQNSPLAVFNESNAESDSQKFTGGLLNAMIILAQIVVMTIIMVLLFKYNCMRVIYSVFGFVIMSILGFTGMLLCSSIIDVLGIVMDYITLSFALYNFAVVGVVAIFWHSPRYVQQVYLILMSSLMAFALTGLQEWTTWILLGLLVLWDLFAVLSPYGPLKHLLNTVKEKNQNIEMLVYSVGGIIWMLSSIPPNSDRIFSVPSSSNEFTPQSTDHLLNQPPPATTDEEDESGLKLGLGDFVFYSVLTARAALSDWITTVTCIVAVTTGMTLTIFLLALFKKALPALPISITFGILFYLVSALTLRELLTATAIARIYL